MIIRNACAQLTPQCIACTGALITGYLCTVSNLSATIVYLIKGCRDTKLRRQQWLKFANATANRALVGALCVSISACCLALLGDYKQAGDAPKLLALF